MTQKNNPRLHIALSVESIARSVDDYSRRLGQKPSVVVPGEYALWRTEALNFSIRKVDKGAGELRHLGWEDAAAGEFSKETDVNAIVWERFTEAQQLAEIDDLWPDRPK